MNKEEIIKEFDRHFNDAKCELEYTKDYELLLSVMLSAQTTDKSVNLVTKDLYKKYDTLDKLDTLSIEEIDNYYSIRLSGNFYCLYSKKINIAVTSNLKVASNNADKIKDNTYIWTIDKNTTNIELVVDKNTPYTKPIKRGISSTFRIVCFIVLVVLSSLAYILYKKKNSSEI